MKRHALNMLGPTTAMILLGGVCATASAEMQVLGVQFRADKPFPQYHRLWHEDSNDPDAPEAGPGLDATAREPLGGSVHVLVLNTGRTPLVVNDVDYAGESLKQCLVFSDQRKVRKFASIYFAKLPPDRLKGLIAAGEPIWWKVDPTAIPPGGTGQIAVRIRKIPDMKGIPLTIKSSAGITRLAVPVQPQQPLVAGAFFGPQLREVFLYFHHPEKGKAPVRILLDGQDVTASAIVGRDDGMNISPVTLRLNQSLQRASFHVFQGVYADGGTASAGLRAWRDEFGYGMWGGPPGKSENTEIGRKHILELAAHNINLQVANIGSPPFQSFVKTPAGQQFAAANGLRFIPDEVHKWGVQQPYLMFIHDEPDCADDKMEGVPSVKRIGGLAQWCIQQGNDLRKGDPDELNMLNLDNTFKPQNWYIYGQLPDVMCLDPYYQVRLRVATWKYPERLRLHSKATYVYAASEVAQSSCQPNPMHVILYACNMTDYENKRVFPFPTPECKRIEAYYALAAGAKGLSYWWYNPVPSEEGPRNADRAQKKQVSSGIGSGPVYGDPGALALWREVGLLGAEIRTLGPVLMESCPADVELRAAKGLWVRSLLSGLNTMVLLVVTDQYANSDKGTTFERIEKAGVTLKLPTWLKSPQVFEVTARGTREVASQASDRQLHVDLGHVDLTRAIVVTTDTRLRGQLQDGFERLFKAKVAKLDEARPRTGAGRRPLGGR